MTVLEAAISNTSTAVIVCSVCYWRFRVWKLRREQRERELDAKDRRELSKLRKTRRMKGQKDFEHVQLLDKTAEILIKLEKSNVPPDRLFEFEARRKRRRRSTGLVDLSSGSGGMIDIISDTSGCSVDLKPALPPPPDARISYKNGKKVRTWKDASGEERTELMMRTEVEIIEAMEVHKAQEVQAILKWVLGESWDT
jgi:hypothetical protein